MNNLILSNTLTMSSREIAKLTNKEHKNVIRDIKLMLINLYGMEYVTKTITENNASKLNAFIQSNLEDIFSYVIDGSELSHELNQQVTIKKDFRGYVSDIRLDMEHSLCLTSGYSVKQRMAIIKRWNELEEVVKSPDVHQILNDPKEMRGLLLTYSEKVISLQNENSELKPKAEALERIAKTDGSMCVTDAAKHLNVQPKFLFNFLSCHGWTYRRLGNRNWVGYQDKIQQGLLEHKVVILGTDDYGADKTADQVRITKKGLTKLSEMLSVSIAN